MRGRTAKVVIALRTGCAVRIWVVHEAHPLVGVVLADLVRCEAVPHAGVDLGHLRPLDDLDLCRVRVARVVCEERPRSVVRASAGRCPNLPYDGGEVTKDVK